MGEKAIYVHEVCRDIGCLVSTERGDMTRGLKLLNNSEDCVREAVEGILLSSSNILALENENVLFRSDIHLIREREVTLLSGGGSGHEPAHAGYIGDGTVGHMMDTLHSKN